MLKVVDVLLYLFEEPPAASEDAAGVVVWRTMSAPMPGKNTGSSLGLTKYSMSGREIFFTVANSAVVMEVAA